MDFFTSTLHPLSQYVMCLRFLWVFFCAFNLARSFVVLCLANVFFSHQNRYVTATKSTSTKRFWLPDVSHLFKFIHIHMLIAKFTAFSNHLNCQIQCRTNLWISKEQTTDGKKMIQFWWDGQARKKKFWFLGFCCSRQWRIENYCFYDRQENSTFDTIAIVHSMKINHIYEHFWDKTFQLMLRLWKRLCNKHRNDTIFKQINLKTAKSFFLSRLRQAAHHQPTNLVQSTLWQINFKQQLNKVNWNVTLRRYTCVNLCV